MEVIGQEKDGIKHPCSHCSVLNIYFNTFLRVFNFQQTVLFNNCKINGKEISSTLRETF